MKKFPPKLLVVPALILMFHLHPPACFAQGTAFTYQGRLNSGGAPANGSYDIAFTLYATNTSGVPIAGPVTNSAVSVTNGLFTTTVDFGDVFTNGSTWLQIAVSTHGANSFFPLTPRQQVTPVPDAVYSGSAGAIPGLVVQSNTNDAPNLIGGSSLNSVSPGAVGATIGGGGATIFPSSVTGNFGTVSGGAQNSAADDATVGGGANNVAGSGATISGGSNNTAGGLDAAIGGGFQNIANGVRASVGGGLKNTASGNFATIPGGFTNFASGDYSFAAGQQAQALNDGSFVWADSQNAVFASTNNDSFNVRAQGGVRFVTSGAGMTVDGPAAVTSLRAPTAGVNTSTYAFIQRAVSTNTIGNVTTIYNPISDNDPKAILIITHNWTDDTNSATKYNTTPVGVYYNGVNGHWGIFNEDGTSMALGRAFNVLVIKP
jgi:hypothetical protein